jgi:hypothetical protein
MQKMTSTNISRGREDKRRGVGAASYRLRNRSLLSSGGSWLPLKKIIPLQCFTLLKLRRPLIQVGLNPPPHTYIGDDRETFPHH